MKSLNLNLELIPSLIEILMDSMEHGENWENKKKRQVITRLLSEVKQEVEKKIEQSEEWRHRSN